MTTISGSSGSDTLSGTNKADSISGGGGNDTISAGGGNDRIDAGSGNDFVDGGAGNDRIDAGSGNDTVYGGDGNDRIDGDSGNDVLYGDAGNDRIDGGSGNDTIRGGDGNDTLIGGAGADQLTGGGGNDTFVYLNASDSRMGGLDSILDFTQGSDKIDLTSFRGAHDLNWSGTIAGTKYGVWSDHSGTGTSLNSTIVYADTNGDGTADLKIELKNTSGLTLASSDFIGVNSSPVAVADTASGTENQTLTIDVLANDRGSGNDGRNDSHDRDDHDDRGNCDHRDDRDDHDERDGHAFTLVSAAAPAITLVSVAAPAGKGTVSVVNNQVQFNPGTDFDHLKEGATEHVTLTYTMQDEHGAQSSSTVDVTVTGTNDAPVVTGAVTGGATEDGATVTLNALAEASDVDDGATLSVVNVPGSLPASVTYNAATHSFTLDPSNAAYQHLAAGEHAMVTVNYGVSDGIATTATSVSWGISGTNDNPELTSGAQSGNVSEGDDGANMSASGQVTFADVDLSDKHALKVSVDASYGKAAVDADGTWHYTVSDAGAVDALAVGEHFSDSFTVQVDDHHGGLATQVVNIDIVGTNDAPVITSKAQSGSVSEGDDGASMSATSQVTFMDVDAHDTHILSVSSRPAYGAASVDPDGTWHYTVIDTGAVDALALGEHLSDSFTVKVDDHHGGFATQDVTITVTGTNDAPMITSNGGGDSADVSVGEGTILVTDVNAADVDHHHSLSFSIVGGADEAKFSINPHSGALTFNDPPVFDHPTDAGMNNVYDVNVQVSDEHGATDLQSIAVMVTVPNVLFTDGDDVVNFNTVIAGTYVPGTQYDAIGGNDIVTLPTDADTAAAAGYNATQTFHGGAGDDTITGGGLNDIIDGGPGNDSIDGGAGTDTASCASVGSDAGMYVDLSLGFAYDRTSDATDLLTSIENVTGSAFNDLIFGNDGANVLDGGAGQDEIYGGDSNDVLIGGLDADHVEGGAGNDTLYGGDGSDALFGGDGNDVLFGNAGNDTFKYVAPTDAGTNGDVIRDFQKGADVLDLQDLLATFNVNGYTPATAFDGGYLNFKHESGNTVVQIDSDGFAGSADTFEPLVTLDGVILNMNDTGDYIL